jgi:hypothetical protein
MGEPVKLEKRKNKLSGVSEEITSAMSSLNMPPETLNADLDAMYLTDMFVWAKHAYEHLMRAREFLDEAHKEKYKLILELREFKCVGCEEKCENCYLDTI